MKYSTGRLEYEPVPYQNTDWRMIENLTRERGKKGRSDIYQIALYIFLLKLWGHKDDLTMEEEESLYSAFMRCRKGKNIMPKAERGYQLALMFMLVRHFFPETPPLLRKEVEKLMETAKLLAEKGNYLRLVSFHAICSFFEVDIRPALTTGEVQKLEKTMAALS